MNNDSLPKLVASADRAYAERQTIESVQESVGLLLQARDDYEVAWRLSRALFFLGQESEANTIDAGSLRLGLADAENELKSARSAYAEGVKAARRAVRAKPERVEGQFWLGVNLALLARLESRPRAITHALQAKRALQQAAAIDAAYHAAGPLRVLARLQHRLPRWLGGGVTRARHNFERALALAPANTVTRIYLAELLCELGEMGRARSELEQVLSVPADPEWAFEIERDRQLATEILGKLDQPR